MSRQISSGDERALAERLKQEALASRPEFRETLHARIRRAVGQCKASGAVTYRRPAASWLSPRWVPAAAAAVCILGALVILWQPDQRGRESSNMGTDGSSKQQAAGSRQQAAGSKSTIHNPQSTILSDANPAKELGALTNLADIAVEEIDFLLGSTVATQQWAYLDHDARLVAQTLVDQLPLDLVAIDVPSID